MDFRIIRPQKRQPNKYDDHVTYVIPVKVLEIKECYPDNSRVHPIIFNRIDFVSGQTKKTLGITFKPTIKTFEDHHKIPPFYTTAIAYKEDNFIRFKIIGVYNPGLVERLYDLEKGILNGDENQIVDIFKHHYKNINEWAKNYNSNQLDF